MYEVKTGQKSIQHCQIWFWQYYNVNKSKTCCLDRHQKNNQKNSGIPRLVFWSLANRIIGKTALIGDLFSTKIAIWDFKF